MSIAFIFSDPSDPGIYFILIFLIVIYSIVNALKNRILKNLFRKNCQVERDQENPPNVGWTVGQSSRPSAPTEDNQTLNYGFRNPENNPTITVEPHSSAPIMTESVDGPPKYDEPPSYEEFVNLKKK